jgi:hypothetical protein
MGVDFRVEIWDNGDSTGLLFDVQLKSTSDRAKLGRKRSATLACKLDVKDLEHWAKSTMLVVLVVWDVEKQTGWWRPIPEIIEELDKASKGWKKQTTVAVSVPLANGINDEGLKRLRWAVADHNLPLVPKSEPSELTFFFPRTAEGAASLAALKRAFDEDDVVVLGGGELIAPRVEYPKWHRRIYGDFDGPVRIEIGRSAPSFTVPVRVVLESSQGTASLPYIELRYVKRGRRKVVLSNEQQEAPVQLHLEIADDHYEFTLRVTGLGGDVYKAQEVAAVRLVMAQARVQVLVTLLKSKRPPIVLDIEKPPDQAEIARLTEWRPLVDKLAFIQQRLPSQRILIPDDGISHADAALVERVFTILSRGTEKGSISKLVSVVSNERALRQHNLRGNQRIVSIGEGEVAPIQFLNTVFEPGPCRIFAADPLSLLAELNRRTQGDRGSEGTRQVVLENVPVIYEYGHWIPEEARWDRLAQLAIGQDGYVTLPQARWSGYTDDIFFALIHSGKVEPVAPDVFRLVHFPRSDHEDLIVPWLQTGRKGVLSHDTALLLHGLSDILPRRRHITVPPGWEPGDRKLDPNVVLHHGEVDQDETRWLGPVPYTAPLRTLRDCIAANLSPDLLEQAITDGLRRGMFTEADLPVGVRRGAA